uniref:Uncharacterized protein n=1 Tax=Hubei diptera virus 21 TaxID=1922882 RepID=A0A1L3KP62_9VIRU|nr:hypothetical protein 1 [Hubei diptera virus 21]
MSNIKSKFQDIGKKAKKSQNSEDLSEDDESVMKEKSSSGSVKGGKKKSGDKESKERSIEKQKDKNEDKDENKTGTKNGEKGKSVPSSNKDLNQSSNSENEKDEESQESADKSKSRNKDKSSDKIRKLNKKEDDTEKIEVSKNSNKEMSDKASVIANEGILKYLTGSGDHVTIINELEKVIKALKLKAASEVNGEVTNVDAVVQHQSIQKANKLIYDKLKGIAATDGPKLDIKAKVMIKPKPFSDNMGVKLLHEVPSFFSIVSIQSNDSKNPYVKVHIPNPCPKYIEASQKAFAYGTSEVKFVMRSTGYPHPIEFNPGVNLSMLSKDVIKDGVGPVNIEASKMDYVLNIFGTAFGMCINSQFVLVNVPLTTLHDRSSFAGDLVSTNGMLETQYYDQNIALLPCAAYGHEARYFYDTLKELFEPPHHAMRIGQIARDTFSRTKILNRVGAITDQYTAALNDRYLNYLFSRSVDRNSYLAQHQVLTLPLVSIKIENPSVFEFTIVPVWKREECDGCLLIFALSVDRQKQYLNHLTRLLQSTGLVSFASITDIGSLPPRQLLTDPIIQQLLDGVLTSIDSDEFFTALSCDLMSSWIDTNLVIKSLGTFPCDHVFRIMIVILWYMYFPSVARDNTPTLMYQLFIALEALAENEVSRYITTIGFSNNPGQTGMIKEYSKEDFLNGEVTFPIITSRPPATYKILRLIHDLLVYDCGKATRTRDSVLINTPRMVDVRYFHQPYDFIRACSNTILDGEIRNTFGVQLKLMMNAIHEVIKAYKTTFKDCASRSAFGSTTLSASQLVAYFKNYSPSALASIGIRNHTEINVLRVLGSDSPFVLDCQNLSKASYKNRPQVLFESEGGRWDPIMMQRHNEPLSFELPLYLFLSLRGASSVKSITPPNTTEEFANLLDLQYEGILCGDLIRFVNNLKFGKVGLFNKEALGISNLVTAARADKIFQHFAKLPGFKDIGDIFKILIDQVSHRIDMRAIGFKIVLQPYNSTSYLQTIPQPLNSLYNCDLRLGRELIDDQMKIISPIFVPETSPIALYTNGLIIHRAFVNDLDPFAAFDIENQFNTFDRVVLWSPQLIGRRVRSAIRIIDEDVLRIPNEDGNIDTFVLDEDCPKLLFILTAKTGQFTQQEYNILLPFIEEGRLSVFYPELMVIMNRAILPQNVTTDICGTEQMKEVLCGPTNRRVVLTFGDTISRSYRLATTTQKKKFLFPVSEINQRDIILRGLDDPVQASSSFYVGSWLSWAHGCGDSKQLIVKPSEAYRNQRGEEIINHGQSDQLINKLELGLVNMNNDVRMLTTDDWIKLPIPSMSSEMVAPNLYAEP